MPRVLNKQFDKIPSDAVYIGRPSPFGNPFIIGKDGSRKDVIQRYREWIVNQPELLVKIEKELSGKDLVCFCAPQPCHGDVLLEVLANKLF